MFCLDAVCNYANERGISVKHSVLRAASLLLFSSFSVIVLCSCGSSGMNTTELGSTDLTYTDTHVSGTLCDGVTVDADIPDLSSVSSYDIVSAHMQQLDDASIKSIKQYVFRGYTADEIKKEVISEEQHTNYFTDSTVTANHVDITLSLFAQPGQQGIIFTRFKDYPHEKPQFDVMIPVTQLDALGSSTEQVDLTFMSRKDAVQTVTNQLHDWNIYPVGSPTVFCCTGDTMYQLLSKWNASGLDYVPVSLEKKDELEHYYMVFETGYHNIPYSHFEYGSELDGTSLYSSKLYVCLSEKGIFDLDYRGANYTIDRTEEQHDSCIPLDQAMSQVKAHYEQLVGTSAVTIKNVFFQYVPTNARAETSSCTLVPAWIIQPQTTTTLDGEEVDLYLDTITVNAITGEVIH